MKSLGALLGDIKGARREKLIERPLLCFTPRKPVPIPILLKHVFWCLSTRHASLSQKFTMVCLVKFSSSVFISNYFGILEAGEL